LNYSSNVKSRSENKICPNSSYKWPGSWRANRINAGEFGAIHGSAVHRADFWLAISGRDAYMPRIRIIDLLVDRAELAPLPKTSLKSDQARDKGRAGASAFAHLGEVK
jgi:hypothetical protein